jgi:hypothetical protein
VTTVGVTGHQDLPAGAVAEIRAELVSVLAAAGDLVGVSSLAAGADQVFAEVTLELGGRLEAVVPCADYETSFATDAAASAYRKMLARATASETLDYPAPTEDAYLAAGRRVAERSELLVAIWDGNPSRGRGGTADVVAYAGQIGVPVRVIWPAGAVRQRSE